MNERDSENVATQFINRGYTLAKSDATADVVLLNTCSVRDTAEQKAINKMVNLAADVRKNRPHVVLGFLGCMAQGRGQDLLDQLRGVDLVVGTQKFHHTADHVEDILHGRQDRICDIGEESGSEAKVREHLPSPAGVQTPVSAFVSIMQGCNQHCTFCIVPFTRGRERSRTIEDVVAECSTLAEQGVREVTLLGQIVTSYAKRELPVREGKSPFVQLLEAVQAVQGIERIRFTSPHPKGYGDDLIEAFGRLDKLCECAHLPVQSGSNDVLKRMHRGYSRERYLEIVAALRRVQPEIGLTTDLIVGFPGETEADFEETLSLVREARFDNAYMFKYSPRRNTPAAELPDQIPQAVIEERHRRLLDQLEEVAVQRYARMVGRQVEVLVEGPSRKNPARVEGRTRCNKIVIFEGAPRHLRQCVPVKVTHASVTTLYGDPAILNVD